VSKLLVGSATDVGLVRSNNEDQYLVSAGLYAVADGMGGHAAGEVASSTAVRALQAAFETVDQPTSSSLESAAKAANRAVWEQARANRGMLGMGTTLVALAVVERPDGTNGLAVAHVGDSRLYMMRDGVLRQVTVDHNLVQELVDDGQITPEQAAVHPQRHVLTRALGVEPSVAVDLIDIVPKHGDRYLLCSDGLPREASPEQMAAVLERFPDPRDAARELVALAKSCGGSDNITAVVVDVASSESSPDTLLVAPRAPAPGGQATGATGATGAGSGPLGGSSGDAPAVQAHDSAGPAPEGPPALARRRSPLHAEVAPRRFTWRVAGFVLSVCIVVGGALGCLAWYARSAYFVTISDGRITVFQGRPGGVLWFQPTLARRTRYRPSSVLAYNLTTLQAGHLEPTLDDATLYINSLVSEKVESEPVTPRSARGAPRHGTATTVSPTSPRAASTRAASTRAASTRAASTRAASTRAASTRAAGATAPSSPTASTSPTTTTVAGRTTRSPK